MVKSPVKPDEHPAALAKSPVLDAAIPDAKAKDTPAKDAPSKPEPAKAAEPEPAPPAKAEGVAASPEATPGHEPAGNPKAPDAAAQADKAGSDPKADPWRAVLKGQTRLQAGDSGAAVAKMQSELNQAGFAVPASGVFDEATKKALVKFQNTYHIQATGELGPQTSNGLEEVVGWKGVASGKDILEPGEQGPSVTMLQRQLVAAGYKVDLSGVYDPKTAAVVKELQRSKGWGPDGKVGPMTVGAIKELQHDDQGSAGPDNVNHVPDDKQGREVYQDNKARLRDLKVQLSQGQKGDMDLFLNNWDMAGWRRRGEEWPCRVSSACVPCHGPGRSSLPHACYAQAGRSGVESAARNTRQSIASNRPVGGEKWKTQMERSLSLWLLSLGLLVSCGGTPTAPPQWYYTCGDPVCRGYTGTAGVAKCTTEKAGGSCTMEGVECDPTDSCNRKLRCATSDPTMQTGGCPISRRSAKTDIQYLGDTELRRYADEVMNLKLATFKYRSGGPTRLGFMIDDNPQSMSVDPERDMVDLYGYASMAMATLKVQKQQISELEQRLDALAKEIKSCRAPQSVASRTKRK